MVLIALGSNLGDKAQNLCTACDLLAAVGVRVLRRSALYRTPPWGITEQDWFLNAVCELSTDAGPEDLLDLLLDTEARMGRLRAQRWGPRLIDLDLIAYHEQQCQTETLHLPHPRFAEREFVLAPLADLVPAWQPVGHGHTIAEMLTGLPRREAQIYPAPACWSNRSW
ncbi:MAG: 2-amino-4-hydroxy-6-hydroxymethyldihydropteridine diphosphokinase [Bacteroidetes bacterium]|nr:MAG: 2-amino-4-hydroxy-6-hydroxymethyldihydropteridine diphosphokinase [Bacteroidota bacterium]